MKLRACLALLMVLLASAAGAGPYYLTKDYYHDSQGYDWGDATSYEFEIWELGSQIVGTQLRFSILTDLPPGGAHAPDSYAPDPLLTSGDLWIRVGTRNPFDGSYPLHAVALTTHDNVAQQKYPSENWPTVTEGLLYKDAQFATATFETYQQLVKPRKPWLAPDDLDGNDAKNSYMTLIKGFSSEVAGKSSVVWDDGTAEAYWLWTGPGPNDYILEPSYRITGYVDLGEIGLTDGMAYSLFVSSECGNDGSGNGPPVAEPGMLSVLAAAGIGLYGMRRRLRG